MPACRPPTWASTPGRWLFQEGGLLRPDGEPGGPDRGLRPPGARCCVARRWWDAAVGRARPPSRRSVRWSSRACLRQPACTSPGATSWVRDGTRRNGLRQASHAAGVRRFGHRYSRFACGRDPERPSGGFLVCDVTASSTTIAFGEQVTVTGTGFIPNTNISVTMQPPKSPRWRPIGAPIYATGMFVVTTTPNQVGNWLFTFSQANGCSDSITITVTWDQICDVTAHLDQRPTGRAGHGDGGAASSRTPHYGHRANPRPQWCPRRPDQCHRHVNRHVYRRPGRQLFPDVQPGGMRMQRLDNHRRWRRRGKSDACTVGNWSALTLPWRNRGSRCGPWS